MPSWVYNVLTVYGENSFEGNRRVVEFLRNHIVDEYFDFNTVIPEPVTIDECPDEYNFLIVNTDKMDTYDTIGKSWFNWYDWRIDNWGTKWNSSGRQFFDFEDILDEDVTGIDNKVHIVFESAWSCPIPIVKKLIEDYPDLKIYCDYFSVESLVLGFIARGSGGGVIHESFELSRKVDDEIL